MSTPVLFKLDDGSTKAVNLDQDFDYYGHIESMNILWPADLFTAVMRVPKLRTLYRVIFPGDNVCQRYLVRLEDDSILTSHKSNFFLSHWVALNHERIIVQRHPCYDPIIFMHLIELEYTFF